MLVSSALVLLMVPGLALFYGGMVRRKNVLATMMQSLVALSLTVMGGLAATTAIKTERPSTVVVMISTEHPSDLPAEASTCGADDVVWKSELRCGVIEAIWMRHHPSG